MTDKLYNVHGTEPGNPFIINDEDDWDGLTFRKELIYAGNFRKRNSDTNQPFIIDEMKLAHWERVGNQMLANGVNVPLPLKHNDSPEAGRGKTLRYERAINNQGIPALYAVLKFRDAEAAKMAGSTDVSIFVPEAPVYDGKGNEYPYPIRHIALTDYPVIPNLEGFEPIAASLDVLELGYLNKLIPKDKGTQTFIAGAGAENAEHHGPSKTSATLHGAAAVLAAREVHHLGKRFGKTAIRQYKKGGVKRVIRAAKTFDKVTRVAKVAPQAIGAHLGQPFFKHKAAMAAEATAKARPIRTAIAKVARTVGNKIPHVGLLGAAAGGLFAAEAIKSGISGVSRYRNRGKELSLSDKVRELKAALALDFSGLELGGPGSGPIAGVKRGPYNIDRAVGHAAAKVGETVSRVTRGALTGRVARYAAKGEAINFLARQIRGDDESRRWSAYGTYGAASKAVQKTLEADQYFQESARESKKLAAAIKLAKPAHKLKTIANSVRYANLKANLAGLFAGTAAVGAGLTGHHLFKKSKTYKPAEKKLSHTLELGGPGSGRRKLTEYAGAIVRSPIAHVAGAGEAINFAAKKLRGDNEDRRASSYLASAAGHATVHSLLAAQRDKKLAALVGKDPSATRIVRHFPFGVIKKVSHVSRNRSLAHTAALLTAAGLVGAGMMRKRKELSLSGVVDAKGNHHAEKGGRFVPKEGGAVSSRTMRRRLNAIKPKKFVYDNIGPIPNRESDESLREYTKRKREFRMQHKTENPRYFKDTSEENVKHNLPASVFQAVKHGSLLGTEAAAATAGGTYAYHAVKRALETDSNAIKGVTIPENLPSKEALDEIQKTGSPKTYKKPGKAGAVGERVPNINQKTAHFASAEAKHLGVSKLTKARVKAIKDTVMADAVATAKHKTIGGLTANILAKGGGMGKVADAIALRKARLTKVAVGRLKNLNWRHAAAAAAVAAAASHDIGERFTATKHHIGNVVKSLRGNK